MHLRRYAAPVVLGLGILWVAYGFYTKHRISSAREEAEKMAQMQEQHSSKIKWSFLGGVVLIILGGGVMYLRSKKRGR